MNTAAALLLIILGAAGENDRWGLTALRGHELASGGRRSPLALSNSALIGTAADDLPLT